MSLVAKTLHHPAHHASSVTLSAISPLLVHSPLFHEPPRLLHKSTQCARRKQRPLYQRHQRRSIYWAHRPTEDAHDITDPKELKTKEILHTGKDELQPKPLTRALGLDYPPEPGQNSGRDERSWNDWYEDFFDADVAKRNRKRVVWEAFHNNHYKDTFNIGKTHWGKSMISPSTPYRSNLALYFPNLQGKNLAKPPVFCDTTPRLRNRISIVGIMGSDMGRQQILSFCGPDENSELHEYMRQYNATAGSEVVQRAFINNEENVIRAAIVRMYFYRQRGMFPSNEWQRFWLNSRGLSMEIRDCLGMWNHKVGYVYLLDGDCKIRWAGNGPAREEERKSLVHCVQRLVEERERKNPGVRLAGAGDALRRALRAKPAAAPVQESGVKPRENERQDKLRRRMETPAS